MKMTIAWHKECLHNRRAYHAKEYERTVNALERLKHEAEKDDFYELQINNAISLGKPDFDQDRFMIRKSIVAGNN